ncbi:Cytochrome P450 [Corchorus capsularis]|uniref:Cytochrome P450 n=1 Tax=Corchorus capsularis TaxID=210143 RepID=A0A1R3K6X9_COCAP|nr:Cytochrome P450 [Corchorus capsularis]
MEAAWFFLFISISITFLTKLIFNFLSQTRKKSGNLPPGPQPLPIIGNLLLFRKSFNDLQRIPHSLHAKFGPIITLHFGSRPAIFIADRFLAHQALVQNGAIFADRPPALDGREQVVITTALYGSTWRVLRRNLTAEMLHSSRVKSYSHARKLVLERLLRLLKVQSNSGVHPVEVIKHFHFSMFSLLVFMCFGDNLEEKKIKEMAHVEREMMLSEENRNLTIEEIRGLCSEFLNGGTDNTATLLQWIMANLVKNPHIQEKLYMEIKRVMGDVKEMVKEDDLQKMPYLKAVILEGLRRHPPLRFLLPHAVTEDAVLNGYLVPRNGTVNFIMGDIGLDEKVWEDPLSFKPERFFSGDNKDGEGFDITGSKEIKMMPFGAGRRICPGYALAMLHLEYFVANLVWNFEWKAVNGDEVNMEEKHEFSVRMKYPLQALIFPRF